LIIEQQRIQVQIRNRTVDVDYTQEIEKEIWKGISSGNNIENAIDYNPNELVDKNNLIKSF